MFNRIPACGFDPKHPFRAEISFPQTDCTMDGNCYLAANKPSLPGLTRYILLILALFGFVGMPSAHPAGNHALQSFAVSTHLMNFGRSARTIVMVEDKETHDPLLGATVSIVSRADTLRGTTVKEDFYRIMAVYRCDRIFRDSVDLEVTYVGYKPFKKRYGNTGFRGRIEVKMEVDEQSIAQVVVVGQQVAMVFRGDTTVYNAGSFKTMADDRFAELLKQLPGVEIKDNKIYAEGQEVKRVLIDGKNLFGTKTSYALTDLEASDVRSVRVYEDFSPEAKRLGDNTAEKEKVMDVETKSKRGYIQGGNLEGTLGASLERDYSGRHEIRHSEAGSFYRNTEKGNWRLEASNSKDNIRQGEGVSFNSKTTPSKQTDAQADYTLRRGDSTNVSTSVRFGRSRQSSTGFSQTEYFPTEAYALRSEESRNESLLRSLSAEISNYVNIQRKKNVFGAMTSFSIDDGSTSGHNRTQQRIDDEKTRTNLNSDFENRNIRLNVNVYYHTRISERSTLSFNVSGKYAPGDRDGWRVDTTASTPGLQVKLRNDGDSRSYSFGANLGYRYKLGKKGSFNASYGFSRDYARSKQLAVDFLSDPQGVVDTVNSYHYTTDTYTHSLQTRLQYRSGDVWMMAGLGGVLYDIARSERFPKEERFPRLFFQLNPTVYLSVGKSRRRFSFNLASFPQMIPLESLRSTLNATNPLSLQAGNPDLKLQNNLSGSAGFQFTDVKKALSFSVQLNGSYTFNYIASRRTLFLEDTYLPRYDYTAQKGAQLTSQTNVGGNYNLGGRISYSQQINPLRSTLNVSVNYGFNQTPYFTGNDLFHSVRHSLGFGFGFDSGFSSKIKINIRSNTSMSSYTTQKETSQELREQLTARVDLRFGKYFGSVGTLYEFYCNSRSHTLTRHNVILNASAGRKFGKENRLGVSVGVIDILNRPDYATTSFDTDYVVTSTTSYLGRYGYLRVAYTF